MKNANNILTIAILAAGCLRLGLAGCAQSMVNPPATSPASDDRAAVTVTAAPVVAREPEATLSDGQIVGIAYAIDKSEIEAGERALSRTSNAQTRQFAAHMVHAHKSLDAKLVALADAQGIGQADSILCEKLKSDNESVGQQLTQMSGAEFDRAYIRAQLKGHEDVLDLLDTKLIPMAQNPMLKDALQATRAKVVEHIHMAEQAQASVGR